MANMSRRMRLFVPLLLVFQLINPTHALANTSTRATQDLPTIEASSKSSLASSSMPPQDLVKLAATIKKSVVTITCSNKLGSGWSIKFNKPISNPENFGSYLITNYHVVSSCLDSVVEIRLSDGTKVNGTVFTWDDNVDLAGIYTSKAIPQLEWQGSNPEQGVWNGVIGSPLGISGTLTTGIVSNIESVKYFGTTTAPINPGNSGGPVFDREGRVFGIATAKYVNSEGFGIFQGTPLLCIKIFACPIGVNSWFGKSAFDSSRAPNPLIIPSITFSAFSNDVDFAAKMLYCRVDPLLPQSLISQYNINGVYIAIYDLTTNKSVAWARLDIPKDSNNKIIIDTEASRNVSLRSTDNPDYYVFASTLKFQRQDHNYQCSVGMIANNLIGELAIAYAKAEVDGEVFKAQPWKKPVPVLPKKSIICQKGTLLKKVTSVKPVCPKGYVKKFDV